MGCHAGTATGGLLRDLTLDWQSTGRADPVPAHPETHEPRTLTWVRGVLDVLRHHRAERPRFREKSPLAECRIRG